MIINPKKPLFGVIEFTTACNLRCIHCGTDAGRPRQNELSTEEMKKIIKQLSNLGCVILSFTGGEPLLRKDFFEVAEYAKTCGLELSILSNGIIINGRIIQKLEELKPVALSVSIDGIGEVHDNFRGVPGAYEKSIRALRLLKETTIPHCTISTITKLNFHQLEELFELMLDLDVWTWQIQIGTPIGRFGKELMLNQEEMRSLARFISEARIRAKGKIEVIAADCLGYFSNPKLRNKPWAGCNAGICLMSITSDGKIKGCLSLPDSTIQGDVRKNTLKEIWESQNSFAFNRKFDLRKLKGKCHNCEKARQCRGGCRTVSFAFNDMYEYPLCLR